MIAARRFLALLLICAACAGSPPRAYYAPAGRPYGYTLAAYVESSDELQIDLRLQGIYENTVNKKAMRTVHLQLAAARPAAGALVLPMSRLAVDLHGSETTTLHLSEAWLGREQVQGDLAIPAWSRRAFDLFFDSSELVGDELPETVLARWEGSAGERAIVGQCLFRMIPEDDVRRPSDEALEDIEFGQRDGYYLPGAIVLGERHLIPSPEERLHYVFHRPRTWSW